MEHHSSLPRASAGRTTSSVLQKNALVTMLLSVALLSTAAFEHIVQHDGETATCADNGPWPCQEDGCPGPLVHCHHLTTLCDSTFDEVWSTLPDDVVPGQRIAEQCIATCTGCGSTVVAREYSMPIGEVTDRDMAPDEWNRHGVGAFERGEYRTAVQLFTVAIHQHTDRGELHSNLALALGTLARVANPSVRLAFACEAKAAAQLAQHLGHHASGLLEALDAGMEEALKVSQGLSCADTVGGELQQRLDRALQALAAHTGAAVDELCSPASAVLQLGAAERARGVLSAKTLRAAWGLMRVCGVLAVDGLMDEAVIASLAEAQRKHFLHVVPRVTAMRARGVEADDGVAVRGSTKRVEVKLPLRPPFTDGRLVADPIGLSLLRLWLRSDSFELDTFSYIHAEPGSVAQGWHTDVGPLSAADMPRSNPTDAMVHPATLEGLPPPFGVVMITPLGSACPQPALARELYVPRTQPASHVTTLVPRSRGHAPHAAPA